MADQLARDIRRTINNVLNALEHRTGISSTRTDKNKWTVHLPVTEVTIKIDGNWFSMASEFMDDVVFPDNDNEVEVYKNIIKLYRSLLETSAKMNGLNIGIENDKIIFVLVRSLEEFHQNQKSQSFVLKGLYSHHLWHEELIEEFIKLVHEFGLKSRTPHQNLPLPKDPPAEA